MKLRAKNFADTRPINFPRGRFDMSHSHQGSYDMGYLYPIFLEEVMASDRWDISQVCHVTMMPTVTPVKHEINLHVHYWFIPFSCMRNIVSGESGLSDTLVKPEWPYRNQDWHRYYSGDFEGDDEQTLVAHEPTAADQTPGSLWDHLGFPMGLSAPNYAANKVWVAPFEAYQLVYNHNYRDENVSSAIKAWNRIPSCFDLRLSSWEKDYFTSAQLSQQRGIAPAIPVEGTATVLFANALKILATSDHTKFAQADAAGVASVHMNANVSGSPTPLIVDPVAINDNDLDLEGLAIAIDQLRLQVATQRFLERNQRDGVRPSEFLRAHFDDAPADGQTDLPEYIGGYRQTIMLNEVIQVSETGTTPQGTRAGVGNAVGGGHVGHFHVKEPGYIMGIARLLPRAMYTQGLRREFRPDRTRYDFPFPEFANLSEQAVRTQEIFASDSTTNDTIFGYQGQMDEYRQRVNRAVGLLRQTVDGLASWNLARNFGSAPGLNEDFITVEVDDLKERIFAVPSEPGFIMTFGNICSADRPIPYIAQPGLLDHV